MWNNKSDEIKSTVNEVTLLLFESQQFEKHYRVSDGSFKDVCSD